ncbi:unnamed protein product, partial [Fusarium graminearum]
MSIRLAILLLTERRSWISRRRTVILPQCLARIVFLRSLSVVLTIWTVRPGVLSVFVAVVLVMVFGLYPPVSLFMLISYYFIDLSLVNRLVAQQEKLEAQEEEAGDRVLASLAEAVSRLQRIRKIKKKVKERGADLFERGVQELDKEDDIVPALQSHEDWVVNDLQSLGVPNETDWS